MGKTLAAAPLRYHRNSNPGLAISWKVKKRLIFDLELIDD